MKYPCSAEIASSIAATLDEASKVNLIFDGQGLDYPDELNDSIIAAAPSSEPSAPDVSTAKKTKTK